MSNIKIIYSRSKDCYFLRINGKFIGFDGYRICAINSPFGTPPYGAAMFISVKAIRDIWADYMPYMDYCIGKPYNSVNGNLILA